MNEYQLLILLKDDVEFIDGKEIYSYKKINYIKSILKKNINYGAKIRELHDFIALNCPSPKFYDLDTELRSITTDLTSANKKNTKINKLELFCLDVKHFISLFHLKFKNVILGQS